MLFIYFFIIINMSVRVSLRAPRLILRILKLTTMLVSSGSKICRTRTGDIYGVNLGSDQLNYTYQGLFIFFYNYK